MPDRHVNERLRFAVERQLTGDASDERYLVRLEVPVPEVDLFAWLQAQAPGARMMWRGRHADDLVAMSGAAMCVEGAAPGISAAAASMEDILNRPGAEPRFYGGVRFDLSPDAAGDWFGFPSYRFILPRFELHRRGARTLLCCNLVLPEDADDREAILEDVDRLEFPARSINGRIERPVRRHDNPGFDGWKAQVRWSLDAFERDVLEKVVLARRVDLAFDSDPDPLLLFRDLQNATPHCFHYLFESEGGTVFMGATPERLFFRRGREVFSEAVAGTRPRGASADDDEAYRASLLASEKDQREHRFVRDSIRDVLAQLCESVNVDEVASEMRLSSGRHLYSRLSGTLRSDVTDLDLLLNLHPTPAVGGHPTLDAVDAIRSLEDFDRGWYAGPIGWLGRDSAEFAVALRCGVLDGSVLSLFSGAGLVQGSECGAEWLEIEQKITDFTKVLGLAVQRTKS
ncbi:MAG: isochorismate synthase [Rhodothermales bacterium]|nr:isochorismate synthase [Rhodothermales bacterium]